MSWSIRLCRVRGIDIRVHVTFVLILVWAAYNWWGSTGAGLRGALFGVVATLLLFVAVTLHELGHSLQALKHGVKVREITLLPIGGVSQLEEMPDKPGQELRIALSGPLVNLAIVAVLCIIGLLLRAQAMVTVRELYASLGQASWQGMLAYLAMANLGMGLFNLVPAFPMDGGRVLRALLAARLGYRRATAAAASVGQGLALLLGLWGFANGGYTLVLIAIFIWMGAGQEGKQVEIESVLGDAQVGDAMTRQPQVLAPEDTLAKAMQMTLSTAQADFPVVEIAAGKPVGLLTEGGLLAGLHARGAEALVGEVMRRQLPTVTPSDRLFEVQQRLAAARLGAVPVVAQDGRLVGLLTIADISEAYRLCAISGKRQCGFTSSRG